jgi:hypothetical protein
MTTASIPLRHLKLRIFTVQYSSWHFLWYGTANILSDPAHPLYIATLRRSKTADRSGLWWTAAGTFAIGKKRVVRSWAARRLRNAFVEALASRGFDRDGKRVVESAKEDGKRDGKENRGTQGSVMQAIKRVDERRNLTGTLRIQANPVILTVKFDAVKQEAGLLVDELVKIARKQDRKGISKERGPPHNGNGSGN